MSKIVKPKPVGLIIPKNIIKEIVDEAHRRDWDDPDRYPRQKAKALRYIPVRAKDKKDATALIREVTRIFHDDLLNDPDIKEAAQQAIWQAQLDKRQAERDGLVEEPEAAVEPERVIRGLDNLTDEKLVDLEWQKYEEDHEP